ncbi:hypothetical protein DdX_19577 [Ditylenchus destructor]|uniref:Uncharacterized protein n=1 Tax=Ditylenchus destructor TaxID=166010 RepID=A0AAD4QU49_9BILA|nr:hypothetical protein DdX_19577 [Ditylenchus destructor]
MIKFEFPVRYSSHDEQAVAILTEVLHRDLKVVDNLLNGKKKKKREEIKMGAVGTLRVSQRGDQFRLHLERCGLSVRMQRVATSIPIQRCLKYTVGIEDARKIMALAKECKVKVKTKGEATDTIKEHDIKARVDKETAKVRRELETIIEKKEAEFSQRERGLKKKLEDTEKSLSKIDEDRKMIEDQRAADQTTFNEIRERLEESIKDLKIKMETTTQEAEDKRVADIASAKAKTEEEYIQKLEDTKTELKGQLEQEKETYERLIASNKESNNTKVMEERNQFLDLIKKNFDLHNTSMITDIMDNAKKAVLGLLEDLSEDGDNAQGGSKLKEVTKAVNEALDDAKRQQLAHMETILKDTASLLEELERIFGGRIEKLAALIVEVDEAIAGLKEAQKIPKKNSPPPSVASSKMSSIGDDMAGNEEEREEAMENAEIVLEKAQSIADEIPSPIPSPPPSEIGSSASSSVSSSASSMGARSGAGANVEGKAAIAESVRSASTTSSKTKAQVPASKSVKSVASSVRSSGTKKAPTKAPSLHRDAAENSKNSKTKSRTASIASSTLSEDQNVSPPLNGTPPRSVVSSASSVVSLEGRMTHAYRKAVSEILGHTAEVAAAEATKAMLIGDDSCCDIDMWIANSSIPAAVDAIKPDSPKVPGKARSVA